MEALKKFESLIDTTYPDIKEFIKSKNDTRIEIEVPYNTGTTWKRLNESCGPVFSGQSLNLIKRRTISFNEKHEYFSITLYLEQFN